MRNYGSFVQRLPSFCDGTRKFLKERRRLVLFGVISSILVVQQTGRVRMEVNVLVHQSDRLPFRRPHSTLYPLDIPGRCFHPKCIHGTTLGQCVLCGRQFNDSQRKSVGWRNAGPHVRYDSVVAALDKGRLVAVKREIRYRLVGGRWNGRQRSFLVLKCGFDSGCWRDGREKRRAVVELEKRFCLVIENLLQAD